MIDAALIALCGIPQPAVARIVSWLAQHEGLGLTIAFSVESTEALMERMAVQPVHGVVIDATLGLEGVSFAQELTRAGYAAVCLADTAGRPHLRQRTAETGIASCPDREPARLAAILRRLLGLSDRPAGEGRVIALHSPRGGAGTSTLSLCLAQALASRGRSAVIAEVGGGGSAVPVMGLRNGGGWADLLPDLTSDLTGDPDGPAVLTRALVEVSPGLHLLPSGGPAVMDQLDSDKVEAVLHLLPACGFAHIIVDTPSELTLPAATALANAHAICLIALPDLVSAFRLVQVQEVLTGLQVPAERVLPVINRTRDAVPQRLLEVLDFLRLRPAIRIPEEAKPPVDIAGRFAGFRPGSGAAKSLASLMEQLVLEVSPS